MTKPVANTVPKEKRKGKKHASRMAALGIPDAPVKLTAKPIQRFQLAQLAATLGVTVDGKISPSESATLALQIWNAAGKALSIENQARILTRGIFIMDRKEWETHAKALIAYFDDCDGAVPGQNDSHEASKSYCLAQKKAGRAVTDVWEAKSTGEILKMICPSTGVSDEFRAAALTELLKYAKQAVESDHSLDLQSDGSDRLKASLGRAWYPLELMDEDTLYGSGIRQLEVLLKKPESACNNSFLGANAQVVRWLAVIHQKHESANMKRPKKTKKDT